MFHRLTRDTRAELESGVNKIAAEEDKQGGSAGADRSLLHAWPPTNQLASRDESRAVNEVNWAVLVLSRRRGSEGDRHPVLTGDAARLRGARAVRRRRADRGFQQVTRRLASDESDETSSRVMRRPREETSSHDTQGTHDTQEVDMEETR
jgi:hypothetical protein